MGGSKGALRTPPSVHFPSFSCSLRQKVCQITGFCLKFRGWRLPLGNSYSATDIRQIIMTNKASFTRHDDISFQHRQIRYRFLCEPTLTLSKQIYYFFICVQNLVSSACNVSLEFFLNGTEIQRIQGF